MIWWPVMLLLLGAPFAVHGWHALDRQRVLHAHALEVDKLHEAAEKSRRAAYAAGRVDGIAEVRAVSRTTLLQPMSLVAADFPDIFLFG